MLTLQLPPPLLSASAYVTFSGVIENGT